MADNGCVLDTTCMEKQMVVCKLLKGKIQTTKYSQPAKQDYQM